MTRQIQAFTDAEPTLPRDDRAATTISQILRDLEATPGERLLPPYATAEPGALLHRIHAEWENNARRRGRKETHSFENLKQWVDDMWAGKTIHSLNHKIRGRPPHTKKEEVEKLLAVLLEHWEVQPDEDAPAEFPDLAKLGLTPKQAAEKIASVLFGPIYTQVRDEIRIEKSRGINPAAFMEAIAREDAYVNPVLDRAMFGDDPTSTLNGVGVTLSRALSKKDGKLSIIYVLKSEEPLQGLGYVEYLYERSFLVSLFLMLRTWSQNQWEPQLPRWQELRNRLFVCVAPHPGHKRASVLRKLGVEYVLPSRPPPEWRAQIGDSFSTHGFQIVARATAHEPKLNYWYFNKPDERDPKRPIAFASLDAPIPKPMQSAHEIIVRSALDRAKAKTKNTSIRQSGWLILNADEFIEAADLGTHKRDVET